MFNILTQMLPTSFKGQQLNTSFRNALRAQELLEDPRLLNGSQDDQLAAYYAAISFIFTSPDDAISSLSLEGVLSGLSWWLSCGNNDKVESYWLRNRVAPDLDSPSFSLNDYNTPPDDYITVEHRQPDGSVTTEKLTRYAILAFDAPDGSVRYKKESRGEPDLLSLYEDNQLIYSGFYKVFGIDLGVTDLHWFTFSALLAELECSEGTLLNSKIKTRAFNPDDYKGKEHAEYRKKMLKAKSESRVLGVLPYVDKKEG